jgi:thioesterase domain-containing protein
MIPAAIAILDSLPLTPNGKLDRLALARRSPEQLRAGEKVAPRDELELALLAILEEVLDDRSLGVTDDFFQAGGHSLLAVRLMARIRERLGRELPLAALFMGATVERLAGLLRQGGPPPSRESLVKLRTVAGSRAPLFLVHPVGGNVLCYAELARALDRDVYGLQMPDPDQAGFPASLEELAAVYLQEIREVRPEPPYHLAGWSMGGVLAFEMARQLGRRDGPAGLLAIIDAEPPLAARGPISDKDLLRRFALDLAGLHAGGEPMCLPELGCGDPLGELFQFARQAGLIPPGLGLSTVRTLFHMFRANVGLARAHEVQPGQPCPDSALLLLADAAAPTPHRRENLARGWSALIGSGLEVRSTPGDHYSLLKAPNVQSLAERIREALAQAEP